MVTVPWLLPMAPPLYAWAELPLKAEPVTATVPGMRLPMPLPPPMTTLSLKVEPVTVNVPKFPMPAPPPSQWTELSPKIELMTVARLAPLKRPPPLMAKLLLKVESATVSVP